MLSSADKKAIVKRLQDLMARYVELDDALWILSQDPAGVRNKVRSYTAELNGFLKRETVNEQVIKEDVSKALVDFEKNLEAFLRSEAVRNRRPTLEKLQQAVFEQYSSQVDIVTNHIGSTLNGRAAQFRAMATAAEIPLARQAAIENYTIRAVSIGNKQYNAVQLGQYWNSMLNEYGTRGSIQYRNGHNYPLTTYIQQRITTSQAETDRLTSVAASTALGLTLGKINQTGTADSCIYWENKYVFMSEEAKAQTLAQFPKMAAKLKSIPTVTDVRADKTHMFKWNCKHRILPTSITALDEGDFEEYFEPDAAKQPRIPSKLDETKLYEQITGEKYAPRESSPIEKLRQAAQVDVKKVSYTIQ